MRLILAATLTANYGVYGPAFELLEGRALAPEREEYLDSEKYEQRSWDLERDDSLAELITRVNAIRREHPALQLDRTLRFHETGNDALLAYSKRLRRRPAWWSWRTSTRGTPRPACCSCPCTSWASTATARTVCTT